MPGGARAPLCRTGMLRALVHQQPIKQQQLSSLPSVHNTYGQWGSCDPLRPLLRRSWHVQRHTLPHMTLQMSSHHLDTYPS